MADPIQWPEDTRQALLQWIDRADGLERSWTVSDAYHQERLLLYFEASPDRIRSLAAFATALGLSTSWIEAWQTASEGADAIFIGWHTDLSSIRLYTQHWEQVISHLPEVKIPLYQGFKRLKDGGYRADAYWPVPLAGSDRVKAPVMDAGLSAGLDSAALSEFIDNWDPNALIWTETASDQRQSWLATVRRLNVPLQVGTHLIAPLAAKNPWGASLLRHAKNYRLTHLAGGKDTEKKQFLTVYFEDSADRQKTALQVH